MNENKDIFQRINSFLSALRRTYEQQGWAGKVLIPGLFLLVGCSLCVVSASLFSAGSRNSSNITSSPLVFPSAGSGPTPTPLFNFGLATFTPFSTLPVPSALPTVTRPSTETPTATLTPSETLPTETGTPIPTATIVLPTMTSVGSIQIISVDKALEYVELQNVGNAIVDLNGWKLVSETGSQSCKLRGLLQPNDILRVWARKGKPGLSCGFSFNIWNDSQSDPAVLYNAQGEEVSRSP